MVVRECNPFLLFAHTRRRKAEAGLVVRRRPRRAKRREKDQERGSVFVRFILLVREMMKAVMEDLNVDVEGKRRGKGI